MLKIFYRRFYILLFLIWLFATTGLFVLSVWGNFDSFINDFSTIFQSDITANSTYSKSTNATNMNSTSVNTAGEEMAFRASDAIINKTKIATNAIRREVAEEVRAVEKSVDEVFTEENKESAPDPIENKESTPDSIGEFIATLVVANKSKANKEQSRQQDGEGQLTDISFTETPDKFLAQIKTTKNVGGITFFWLDNPTRLAVDLRGKWENEAPHLHRFSDSFISLVVLGIHPDRLRVGFKFTDPKAPMGQKPELVRTPDGLNIVVNKTTK